MSRRRRYRDYSYRERPAGLEYALEHIREAEQLTATLGGTDRDVKQYFFSLPKADLKAVLDAYEEEHGRPAREYASRNMSKWQSGQVKMSGMVASRLFSLLPHFMPIKDKLKLTESLWHNVGPSSNKTFYVGYDASIDLVLEKVRNHLEQTIVPREIPKGLESRFDWLADGDVAIKQQLLNHFQQQESQLLEEAIKTKLPILLEHVKSLQGDHTTNATQELNVGRHKVELVLMESASGVSEYLPKKQSESSESFFDVISKWFWILFFLYAIYTFITW